jgi:hypothetical protein
MLQEVEPPQMFEEAYSIKEYKFIEKWWGYIREGYYGKQFLHRTDGPALQRFCDGVLELETYVVNNELHKLDGPAIIDYNTDGSIKEEEYFILGKFVTEEDFKTPGFIDLFILENS